MKKGWLDEKKVFIRDKETGCIGLRGAGAFFREQNRKYPDPKHLYREQLTVVLKGASDDIKVCFRTNDAY